MRKCIVGLLLAAVIGAQGCYGPFELTKKLHSWNGSLGNKWVVEGVFLVCSWLPVYSIAVLVDAVVLNSVEFWTGKSMLKSSLPTELRQGDDKVVMTRYPGSEVMRLDIYKAGKAVDTVLITPSKDGSMVATTMDGKRIVSRMGDDGRVVVSKGSKVLGTYDKSEADRYIQ